MQKGGFWYIFITIHEFRGESAAPGKTSPGWRKAGG